MKKAIVTLNINVSMLIHFSKPLFLLYATKVKADYVEINEPKIKHPIDPMLEKYQLYDLLDRYERIVFFDADILVQPRTPNLFDIVPSEKIGAVYDSPDNNEHNKNRMENVMSIQKILGDINWREGYINSGVIVLSKQHRNIFTYEIKLDKISQCGMLEQNLTNYKIRKHKFPIFKLNNRFNRIAFGNLERFQDETGNLVDVLHFAGLSRKIDLMEKFFYRICAGRKRGLGD